MFDDKPIPLPEEETPEHIGLARQGDIKTDAPLVKGPDQLESFNKMKQLATEAPVLAFFKTGRPIQDDKTWKPISFCSKSMTPTEHVATDDMPSAPHPDDNRAEHGAIGILGPKKQQNTSQMG
ncbi:hypothetical protein E4U45_002940 [Claviceps purpurea]|nr:hypothetical protein E4U45_002940 [Claviceps purpurea]